MKGVACLITASDTIILNILFIFLVSFVVSFSTAYLFAGFQERFFNYSLAILKCFVLRTNHNIYHSSRGDHGNDRNDEKTFRADTTSLYIYCYCLL